MVMKNNQIASLSHFTIKNKACLLARLTRPLANPGFVAKNG
jgi:hypothetical protein